MIKDAVKCNNCDWIGLVDCGKNICPKCKKEGCLSWQDNNEQEVEETKYQKREKIQNDLG